MVSKGRVRKGQDVHHKDGNPLHNSKSNLAVTSVHYNRSRNAHKTQRR